MKKLTIIITFLVSSIFGYTQDTVISKRIVDLSLSLSGIGGDYVTNSFGIQAGVEFRLKNNVSMQCDLRYIFDLDSQKEYGEFYIDVDDVVGFAINTEVKKYVGQYRNELKGGYYGGKALGLYTIAYQDDHQIKRIKLGLYATIGWKYIARSGFLFETMAGLGPQLIIGTSDDNVPNGYYQSTEFPWPKQYDSGTSLFPDLTWNVRIGWRF